MTRRHDGLMPLTHDHHHALAHSRRLLLAAGGDAQELLWESQRFLDFFREDTLHHFREEEEVVFPLAVADKRATALLSSVVAEHLQIHGMVARLAAEVGQGRVQEKTANGLAEALAAHIRLEEREVFPMLEKVVSDDQLRSIKLEPRNRHASALA